MTRRLHILLMGLFVGLFLTVQIASTAHAARYDDAPHEHDGVTCMLGTVAAEDQAVMPLETQSTFQQMAVAPLYTADFTSAAYITPQGRAPPPRSPPLPIL